MGDAALLGTEFSDADIVGARKELERLVGDLTRDGITTTSQIATGFPDQVLVEVANSGSYDLLVMGTHGRGGLRRLALGSVAEHVVRHSAIPVLTIRAPQARVVAAGAGGQSIQTRSSG